MQNYIIISLVVMVLLCGCFADAPLNNGYFARWSDKQVVDYFNSISNIADLSNDLIAKGYSWQSAGDNISYWTDQFLEPNATLARGWGNCNDWAAVYLNYCAYKKNVNSVTQYLLYKHPTMLNGWHYISLINDNGTLYHQSNLSVSIVANTEEVMIYWIQLGYIFQQEVKKVVIK